MVWIQEAEGVFEEKPVCGSLKQLKILIADSLKKVKYVQRM